MLNTTIIGLFAITFGLKVTVFYIAISMGSLIYGFMPIGFVSQVANEDNLFAIPVAAGLSSHSISTLKRSIH
ncbi:hypothetical protein JIN82_12065 [Persicirhabdus sediminis]|uniref:Uncharacterized protein n=1 Tax=Persicirhabdus sediminis TaxID=454144 RepID=A0A8J7MDM3_9BACT|nr:hypothetical protein [Persicirhabdus sediminis]MBK1791889.1 hypothetical protein [Persicirhabdus sediminis]